MDEGIQPHHSKEGNKMSASWMEQNKPMLRGAGWGFVAGAIALAVVGFNFGGWYTGGGAKKLASDASDAAVQSALTPVCAAQFMGRPDAQTQLVALKAKDSYGQGEMIGKLIKIPGQDSLSYTVTNDCAKQIMGSLKSAKK